MRAKKRVSTRDGKEEPSSFIVLQKKFSHLPSTKKEGTACAFIFSPDRNHRYRILQEKSKLFFKTKTYQ